MRRLILGVACGICCATAIAQNAAIRTAFRVKYVAEGVVYLDGGRNAGLAEHMRLTVKRAAGTDSAAEAVIGELVIASAADASSVCDVKSTTAGIRAGDIAYLSSEDIQALQSMRSAASGRNYAQVVSFTEGDPLDEEAREAVPAPPLAEVNRVRGRFGFEYSSIFDQGGSGLHSSETGFVFRGDLTRIGGTYWNLSGYSRGRFNSRTAGPRQETLTDLLNRTYHLVLSYNNPKSRWTAGFGRFLLPWASSLNTIDGAYIGRRYSKSITVGTFGGSTPDPTSWNYKANRQIFGSFVNVEGGSYDDFRYSSTSGLALTRLSWHPERQFAFFENGLFYKRYLSLYHNVETDMLTRVNGNGVALSRSFLTVRLQPSKIISFDLSHNYFRDFPTFDPRLVGTGLLDKLLFQGISGGFRVELPLHLSFYTNLGKSDKTGDARSSWNQMYGLMMNQIWRTGVRGDIRYSRFDSAFGRGAYKSLSLSREVREALRFEVQGGQQNFSSLFSRQNRARWVNANLDWFFVRHYFLGTGLTVYRGQTQNYNQTYLNLGYRF